MPQINYLAVLVSAVAIFLLGGLWYSFLFQKKWVALQGKTMGEGSATGGPTVSMFIQVFICGLLTAWVMAVAIGLLPVFSVVRGLKLAVLVWLGFAAATSYGTYLFSMKPKQLWLIDTSYNLVSFLIAAAIIGIWR
jgi:hypothetical protein